MTGPTRHNNANDRRASRLVLCRTSRWLCATHNKTAKPAQAARRATTTRRRKASRPVLGARPKRENPRRHTLEVPGWLEGARPAGSWCLDPRLRLITLDCVQSKGSKQTEKESRPRAAGLQCFTSQGAGTQHPMHFSCAPARSHTITTNNKATRQT